MDERLLINMPKINVLSNSVADKIAAGEVAERPMSVVKELVENSIDAGADKITVEIKNGGISYISISDNGCGIAADEAEIAFLRHATSKLREVEDLDKISTMGFRGEALASISAVSEVELITRTADEEEGIFIKFSHGKIVEKDIIGCNVGTIMTVKNLFSNVPARMKFLKKDSTESGYVSDVLGRIAMSKPHIAFKLINDGKEIFATSGDGSLANVILKIYGLEYAKSLFDIEYSEGGITLSGVLGKPEISRGNRTRQTVFVNDRYVKNHIISKVIEDGYRNSLMKGKFPFFVINIKIATELVDVNVHPAKTEVKFANEQRLYEIINRAVKNTLYSGKNINENSILDKSPLFNVSMTDPLTAEKNSTKSTAYEDMRHPAFGYNSFQNCEKPIKSDFKSQYKLNIPRLSHSNSQEQSTLNKTEQKSAFEFLDNASEFKNNSVDFSDESKNSINEPKLKVSEKEYFSDSIVIEEINNHSEEKIIGQLFKTYIITEDEHSMYLIDQHAAHERFRFEDLLRKFNEKICIGQILLVPIVMSLTQSEIQVIEKNKDRFARLGFEIEDFGNNSIIIHQVPVETDDAEIKNLVTQLIEIFEHNRNCDITDIELHALETISCKYAIKANKILSEREMQDIVNKLKSLNERGITTCPHGRPIKVAFSKTEIEKMFKRIV